MVLSPGLVKRDKVAGVEEPSCGQLVLGDLHLWWRTLSLQCKAAVVLQGGLCQTSKVSCVSSLTLQVVFRRGCSLNSPAALPEQPADKLSQSAIVQTGLHPPQCPCLQHH